MNFIIPTISSILQASSFTLDKTILSIKNVSHKTYLGISFPLTFIATLLIFLIFRPPLTLDLFVGRYFWLILALIVLVIFTNLIFYNALKHDKLGEIQTIDLLRNVPLILFAGFFFPLERDLLVISLALIASFSIIWSHWEKHHFVIAKRTFPFLMWTILMAPFTGIIMRVLLEVWNPISLQLISDGAIALILGPLFFKYAKKISKKGILLLLLTNLLTSIAWILYYFSFQISGIVFTVLIFSLQPLLVYLASFIFLKEKHHWKKTLAFVIVLASITLAQIL